MKLYQSKIKNSRSIGYWASHKQTEEDVKEKVKEIFQKLVSELKLKNVEQPEVEFNEMYGPSATAVADLRENKIILPPPGWILESHIIHELSHIIQYKKNSWLSWHYWYYISKELPREELNNWSLLKLIRKYQKARDIFIEGFAKLIECGIAMDQMVFNEEHSLGHELFSTITLAYGEDIACQFGLVARPDPEILKNAYVKACNLINKEPNEILMSYFR